MNFEFVSGRKGDIGIAAASVLVTLFICARFTRPDMFSSRKPDSQGITEGARIEIPGVNWSGVDHTLVVALLDGCRFCRESAPFYRRVIQAAEDSNSLQVIAALPQDVGRSRHYLDSLQVPIRDVRNVDFDSLGIQYTPTLLLVDHRGIVKRVWVGKLSESGEADVLAKAARVR